VPVAVHFKSYNFAFYLLTMVLVYWGFTGFNEPNWLVLIVAAISSIVAFFVDFKEEPD
jgi:hypothetical protein